MIQFINNDNEINSGKCLFHYMYFVQSRSCSHPYMSFNDSFISTFLYEKLQDVRMCVAAFGKK